MKYIFSQHALEQMELRNISKEIVRRVLAKPEQTIIEKKKKIFQSVVHFSDGNYLIRIFVNTIKKPNLIITVYRTSKIRKYYEG